ncbi:uncharacterized protein RJT20DRAFT_3186 [Scheffersomyces xylosifermentans]|uniref:uncharacterized protein n=1 Tax=Scheffersomyces xylosifermentans TaxID=1304137 RepID=UPI00315D0F3F
MNNDLSSLAKLAPIDILGSFKIFFQKKVFFCLLPLGLQFTTWTMSLTTLSTSLETKYGFSIIRIRIGLCYLAHGIGTLIGSLVSGRILDYIYAMTSNMNN